jgi:1,6-anhydro-N-acetylmuramate kinase
LSAPREHPEHLVICGGGASAVLLLHALRRRAELPISVTIIEERPTAGVMYENSIDAFDASCQW